MTALSRHKIQGKLCKRLHSPSKIQSFYLFWVKGGVRGVPGDQWDVHVVPGVKVYVRGVPGGQVGQLEGPSGSMGRSEESHRINGQS